MSKLIFTIILAALTLPLYAQSAAPAPAAQGVSMTKTDWLSSFSQVDVNGPLRIVFKRVSSDEEVKIVYDTKGNITSKFKADIDANGVLRITERFEPQRTTVTEVTLYYRSLSSVDISQAQAQFEDVVETQIFDMHVGGGAVVSAEVDCKDIDLSCTGRSSVVITGKTRYATMDISTAQVDCWGLNSISTVVEASHGADVRVVATERLEAVTATSAKVSYKGRPEILRVRTQLFGGDILAVEQ